MNSDQVDDGPARIEMDLNLPLGATARSLKDGKVHVYIGRTTVTRNGAVFGHTYWFRAEVDDRTACWAETRFSYTASLIKVFPDFERYRFVRG